ncbi:MAG: type II toxin-antitoxin system PemK/MazF family toxin [Candidatus Altimarinota bacterium]
MIEPRQGEIYLVQWNPAIGHEFQKTRPGVVISSNETIQKSQLVTFMAITASGMPLDEDILIEKNNINRLAHDSAIKVHHISSFDRKRILQYIGEVDQETMNAIKEYLKDHFDL